MPSDAPKVIVLAGPNGAGKTTASRHLLQGELKVPHFVNADVIARGLSGFSPESVAFEAGRIMIERMEALAAARADFAYETTLASKTGASRLKTLQARGYRSYLIFLYLPDAQMAIDRVRGRVATGGHDVPADTIRLRHERGLQHFFRLYRPLVDDWYFYDNSSGGPPRLIAAGTYGVEATIADAILWRKIEQRYA